MFVSSPSHVSLSSFLWKEDGEKGKEEKPACEMKGLNKVHSYLFFPHPHKLVTEVYSSGHELPSTWTWPAANPFGGLNEKKQSQCSHSVRQTENYRSNCTQVMASHYTYYWERVSCPCSLCLTHFRHEVFENCWLSARVRWSFLTFIAIRRQTGSRHTKIPFLLFGGQRLMGREKL